MAAAVLPASDGHNIGSKGQNARLRMAVGCLGIGLGMAILLIKGGFPPVYRLACFVPFYIGAFTALQGLYRTCPLHALRGTREDDNGHVDPVIRGDECRLARRLARRVTVGSMVTAVLSTVTVFFIA